MDFDPAVPCDEHAQAPMAYLWPGVGAVCGDCQRREVGDPEGVPPGMESAPAIGGESCAVCEEPIIPESG